jgi:hypothetical protein
MLGQIIGDFFQKLSVCLGRGFTEFMVPQRELRLLEKDLAAAMQPGGSAIRECIELRSSRDQKTAVSDGRGLWN